MALHAIASPLERLALVCAGRNADMMAPEQLGAQSVSSRRLPVDGEFAPRAMRAQCRARSSYKSHCCRASISHSPRQASRSPHIRLDAVRPARPLAVSACLGVAAAAVGGAEATETAAAPSARESTESTQAEDADVGEVLRIVTSRVVDRRTEYLIDWADEHPDSWEPAENIAGDLLAAFEGPWWAASRKAEQEALEVRWAAEEGREEEGVGGREGGKGKEGKGVDCRMSVAGQHGTGGCCWQFPCCLSTFRTSPAPSHRLQKLLAEGRDVNAIDANGRTALHFVAGFGNEKVWGERRGRNTPQYGASLALTCRHTMKDQHTLQTGRKATPMGSSIWEDSANRS